MCRCYREQQAPTEFYCCVVTLKIDAFHAGFTAFAAADVIFLSAEVDSSDSRHDKKR